MREEIRVAPDDIEEQEMIVAKMQSQGYRHVGFRREVVLIFEKNEDIGSESETELDVMFGSSKKPSSGGPC